MLPRHDFLRCGDLEIAVTRWGHPSNPPLIAWHGLTRNGRDFDWLAGALCDRYHVICPDAPGRGQSSWARDPRQTYCFASYADAALEMMDSLLVERAAWLGTSMGGGLGIYLAGGPAGGRITKLIINDIGPALPHAAVTRIKTYAGQPPTFDEMTELVSYLRQVHAPFGIRDPEKWRHLARHAARRLPDGRLTLQYDPEIVAQLEYWPDDYALWDRYDAIFCPTMLIRGAETDLLPESVAEEMTRRGPRCLRVDIQDVGHAPAFDTPDQQRRIATFLDA